MDDLLELKQSRKWLVTINNPADHGLSHDVIINTLSAIRGNSFYWCMCDEEGDECATLHTHVFIYRKSPFTAKQINQLFPNCHRDTCYGTPAENRAYVLKDGDKYNKQPDGRYDYTDSSGKHHVGVNYSDTFFEFGQCPDEHQGKDSSADLIVEMIRSGADNEQIVNTVSSAYKDLDKIERVRSMYRDKKFANSWRDLQVVYIFGATGTGKTSSVVKEFGYENIYTVSDYKHPFDTYDGQDVIVFDEYRGNIKLGDMLRYLDGHPILLPCRYFNRQACYTKVFIITNIPPDHQYINVDKETLLAFYRRIHIVREFEGYGLISEYHGVQAYLDRHKWVQECIGQDAEPVRWR